MEIPYYKLICTGQILVLWMPVVLAGCDQDMNVLELVEMQKFIALERELHINCQSLLDEQTEECSEDCDEQVQQMVELYHGSAIYFTCDCTVPSAPYPEETCLKVQDRLAVCLTLRTLLVTRAATPPASTTATVLVDGRIPCDTARWRCMKDTNCELQLEATISSCDSPGCSDGCQRSLDTLLAQREAQGMWDCTGCGQGAEEGNWCDLSKRCTDAREDEGTVAPYKLGGTAQTTDNESKGGSARKSVKPSPGNGARPAGALCLSSVALYLIVSVSLCIVFV